MNPNIKRFDHAVFKFLRVEMVDGEPWFVANDVTDSLGYSRGRDAVSRHVDKADAVKRSIRSGGQQREVTFINEAGVYALIFGSKLEGAKEFKQWVFKEVLPSIRKTGGFVSDVDQIMDTFYKNESPEVRAIIRSGLIYRQETQGKVDFATAVEACQNSVDMKRYAAELGIGRNTLFSNLRDIGLLMKDNIPYSRYINTTKWFEVIPVTKNGVVHNKTLVTPLGQVKIVGKLKEANLL